jgi:predicted acylesterase/phospholipase RssA
MLKLAKNISESQRVLIFQAEGALGAYEAAVFKELYKKLVKEDKETGREEDTRFHIVAGTSMGAINAAIIVSHVIENGTWEGSVDKLDNFWNHITGYSLADRVASVMEKTPTYKEWWDYWHKMHPKLASAQEARKYYSAKEFLLFGLPNVFSSPTPVLDTKYFDPQNIWYRYDNEPLKKTIQQFVKFPISTNFDKGQPRLLLVGVDVEEGERVIFDSYSKQSKYAYDKKSNEFKHVISYDRGLMLEHLMASASIPIHFDYTWVPKQYDYDKGEKNHDVSRPFWEGSILSNTPLRDVISKHKTFWQTRIGSEKLFDTSLATGTKATIPNLEVYIVNTWPASAKEIPIDRDGMMTRRNNITFHDKTAYDEKVALLITDYIDLAKNIRDIAMRQMKDSNQRDGFQKELDNFLQKTKTKSEFKTGERRRYVDLLKGRFGIGKVVHIELEAD